MKIIGVGIDIVESFRVEKSLKNKKFVTRIFTSKEISLTWNEWETFENKYTFIYKKIM